MDQWEDRVKTSRSHGMLPWAILPLIVAGFVVADPAISSLFSQEIWAAFRLDRTPLKMTPLALAFAFIGSIAFGLARKADGYSTLAITAIFVTAQLNGIRLGPLDTFDIALFGSMLAWVAHKGLDPTRDVRISPLFFLAGGIVLLATAHLPVSNPVSWLIGLFGVARVFLLAFLLVDLCRDERMLEFALRLFVTVAVISAGIGIIQFLLAYSQLLVFTLIDPPLSAYKPTPIGFVMRASGLSITAQHYASFLIYSLPFALWRFTEKPTLPSALGCGIILFGIAVSLNFGGIFATILVLILFPFFRWRSYSIHFVLAALLLFATAYFSGLLQLIYDLSFGDQGIAKGVDQRKVLFELGLEKVASNPFVGTGLRGFANVDGNFWQRPVHNIFGQAAAELGIGAALLLGLIFFYLSLALFRISRLGGAPGKYGSVCLMMLIAAFFHAQSEPNLDQSNFWIVLGLAQAAVMVFQRQRATG